MDGNLIYDPLKSYQNIFREKHHTNTTAFFDELVKKSEINVLKTNKLLLKLTNSIIKLTIWKMNFLKDGALKLF